jgi:hypothetical protein
MKETGHSSLNILSVYRGNYIPEMSAVLWEITRHDQLKLNRRFGEAYHFRIQGEQESSVKAKIPEVATY